MGSWLPNSYVNLLRCSAGSFSVVRRDHCARAMLWIFRPVDDTGLWRPFPRWNNISTLFILCYSIFTLYNTLYQYSNIANYATRRNYGRKPYMLYRFSNKKIAAKLHESSVEVNNISSSGRCSLAGAYFQQILALATQLARMLTTYNAFSSMTTPNQHEPLEETRSDKILRSKWFSWNRPWKLGAVFTLPFILCHPSYLICFCDILPFY